MASPLAALGVLQPPSVGGFNPFMITAMIPYMGLQSAVMATKFGVFYQGGKRSVDAQKNEEFNKKQFDDLVKPMLDAAFREFQRELPIFSGMQKQFIDEMVKVELAKVEATVRLFKELPKEYVDQIVNPNKVDTIQEAIGITPVGESSGSLLKDIGISIGNFFNSFASIPTAYADQIKNNTIIGPLKPNDPPATLLNALDTAKEVFEDTAKKEQRLELEKSQIINNQSPFTVVVAFTSYVYTRSGGTSPSRIDYKKYDMKLDDHIKEINRLRALSEDLKRKSNASGSQNSYFLEHLKYHTAIPRYSTEVHKITGKWI